MNRRSFALICTLALASACENDLMAPDDARITCTEDGDDCPDGFVCKPSLGQCVPADSGDDAAPSVTDRSVTPPNAGQGSVVRAEFIVDEPLHAQPEVRIVGLDDASFLLATRVPEGAGERFAYEYTIRGSEPEGALAVVALGLIDRWGNENPTVSLGEVTVDFTPPEAPEVSVAEALGGSRVNLVEATLVLHNFTEAAAVRVSGSGQVDDAGWVPSVAQLAVTLADVEGQGDGPRALFVEYRDRAGNTSAGTDLTLDLDRTAPELLDLELSIEGGFSAATDGSTLTVAGFSELDAEVLSLSTSYRVDGAETPGERLEDGWAVDDTGHFAVEILLDEIPAGADRICADLVVSDGLNASQPTGCELAGYPVDVLAPEAPQLAVEEASPTNGHDPSRPWVTLQLGVDNAGRAGDLSDIEAYLSGEGLSDADEHKNRWLPYPADGRLAVFLSSGDGAKPLTAKYRDGAGNETAATATASLTLDTEPPTDFDVSGPTEVSQDVITILIQGQGGSELLIEGDVAASPQTFQWIPWASSVVGIPLNDSAEQAYTLRVQGRDPAGNLTEVKTLTTTISGEAAPFSLPVLTPPAGQTAVKTGDVVAASGTTCSGCTLSHADLVILDAGAGELERRDVTGDLDGTWGLSAVTFSGDLTLGSLPGAAAGLLLEVIVERSGEQSLPAASQSFPIDVDNTPPSNGRVEAATSVTRERTVTLYFTVTNTGNEGSVDDLELRISGDRIDPASGGDGRPITELAPDVWLPYTAEGTVLLSDDESTGSISVSYRDGAHNEISGTAAAVTYDATAPQDPSLGISPASKTASATVDLTLGAVGADEMLISGDLVVGAGVGSWVAYATVAQVSLTAGDGPKTVLARFRDRAGNETDPVSAVVELDTLAPSGALTVSLTDGRTAMASNGAALVSGAASGDASLSGVDWVFLDVGGQETGRVAEAGVTLTDGVIAGTINAGVIPANTVSLQLEADLDDGASTATVTSNAIAVDDTAPAGLTLAFVSTAPVNTHTAATAVEVTVGVDNPGQADNADLQMLFGGAGLASDDPLNGNWVPYAASATLNLSDGDELKTATVTVRDGAHNAVGPTPAMITLDTTRPTFPSLVIQGPAETSTTQLTISLSCSGASEVLITGDEVVAQAGVTHEWIPIPPSGNLNIQITAAPGPKAVNGKFRDSAGNESDDVSDAVVFNSDRPVSSPLLIAPAGQSRVKWNDALDFGGTALADSVIESSRLVFLDAGDAEVGERALLGTEIFLDLVSGFFSGQVTLLEAETPLTATKVLVEAVIRRSGGACPDDCSDAQFSRSGSLLIDRQAPQSGALTIDEGLDVNTRQVTAVFGIDNVGEPGQDDIELRVSGSGIDASTPHLDEWIGYRASLDLVLTTGEGNKIVEVTYRDGAHHVEGPVQVTVNYDVSAPSGLSLVIAGGDAKTGDLSVTAAPGATGAFEMYLTGDVSGPAGNVDQWIPYATTVNLDLTDVEGPHVVLVSVRDRAGNTGGPVSDGIHVDRVDPVISLTLSPPVGKTAAAGGDVLDVAGQTEALATVDSVRVLDQTSTPIPAASANVSVDAPSGAIGGTVTLPGAGSLGGVSTVALELIVSDGLNLSVAADSRSNAVDVDVSPPQIIGLTLAPPAGQTRVKDGDVMTVSGTTEAGAALVSATLAGAGAPNRDASGSVNVDAAGNLGGNVALGAWVGADVRVEVVVTDAAGNSSGNTVSASLTVDNVAPSISSVLVVEDPDGSAPWCNVDDTATLNLGASEGGCSFNVDGDVASPTGFVASPVSVVLSAGDGDKSLSIDVRDAAGNEGGSVISIRRDGSVPSASVGPTIELGDRTDIAAASSYGISGTLSEPGLTLVSADLGYWDGLNFTAVDDITGDVEISGTELRHTSLIAAPPGLTHGSTVLARFVVTDCASTTTLDSGPVDVDNTTPSITNVTIAGSGGVAGMTNAQDITVEVEASGAPQQLRITGDGVAPGAWTSWSDYDFGTHPPVLVFVTGGEGTKDIDVEVRDAAHNTASDTNYSIELDTLSPDLAVGIDLAEAGAGKTHVHDNDDGLIVVSGSANEGSCTIDRAWLMGYDGIGSYTFLLDATADVSIDGATGALSGSFDLLGVGTASSYASVVLEVLVADEVGNTSPPMLSRSNEIPVDQQVPQNIGLVLNGDQDDPTNHAFVQVDASSDDATSVCFYGADLEVGAAHCDQTSSFVPLASSPMTFVVELAGTNGTNTINAVFRDQSFNEDDTSTTVVFDDIAPTVVASAWRTDPGDKTQNLNGTDFAWDDDGIVTMQFQTDEWPVELALWGDVESSWINLTNCDRVGSSPTRCLIDFTAVDCAVTCEVTFELDHGVINGAQPCDSAAYALDDGPKNVLYALSDPSGNTSTTDSIRAELDRTCPSQMALQNTTVPQFVDVAGTKYIPSSDIVLYVEQGAADQDFVEYEWQVNAGGWTGTGDNNTSFTFGVAEGMVEGANTIEIRGSDLKQDPTTPITAFNVVADTIDPSQPGIGPSGVTFNGEELTVLITQKSLDPGGDPDGADLAYQVFGGMYTEWTDVVFDPLALSGNAAVHMPFFETPVGLPQQQVNTFFVRTVDNAGNTSPPAVLSVTEETTREAYSTSAGMFEYNVGLRGEHLAWLEGHPPDLYHRDLGGQLDLVWSSPGAQVPSIREVQVSGRFIVWQGVDASDLAHIYFHDLGADEMYNTGDEDAFATPTEEVLDLEYVATPGSGSDASFDYDPERAEIAFVEGNDVSDVTPDSLYVADTNSPVATPFIIHEICTDCVGMLGGQTRVALHDGCVVYHDDADRLQMHCRVNDTWGDGDDTLTALNEAAGDCSHPVEVALGRRLDAGEVGGDRVVVWAELDTAPNPSEAGVCLWRESTGTATRLHTATNNSIIGTILDGDNLYFIAYVAPTTARLYRYDLTGPGPAEIIDEVAGGKIDNLAAWQDKVAFRRYLETENRLEIYEDSNERQISTGQWDHMMADIDGDRVVWVDLSKHDCGDIMMYDAARNAVIQLTDTVCPTNDDPGPILVCPKIAGQRVIWQESTGTARQKDGYGNYDQQGCFGHVYGLPDVSGDPPYGPPVDITANITRTLPPGDPVDPPVFRTALSTDHVIFESTGHPAGRTLYHYAWGGAVPADDSDYLVEYGLDPDLDGNRLVYLGYWDAGAPDFYLAVCACEIGTDCDSDVHAQTDHILVPRANPGCPDWTACIYKASPRVLGSRVVWYDNRAEVGFAGNAAMQIYEIPTAGPSGPGTQVSTMGVYNATDSNLILNSSLIDIDLSTDFLITTGLRKVPGGTRREVRRIDFTGPLAYQEQTLTHLEERQGYPAVDAAGRVVWQDKRDGVFWQIFRYDTP